MRPRRVAVVGTGGIADFSHMPALRAHRDRVRVVGAYDEDPHRSDGFGRRHGVEVGFTSLGHLLEATRPDLVHICTPPAFHTALALECMSAGAAVLCEKPLCASLAELDTLERAERSTGRSCSSVLQWRFGSGARHLRRLIDGGALGSPYLALCAVLWHRDAAYYAAPWRGRWATEVGGPTVSQAVHAIDLVTWLMGPWTQVRAVAARLDRPVETEDVSMALVHLASGALANLTATVLATREETYCRFDFARATVELRHLYSYHNACWSFTGRPGQDEQELQAWRTIEGEDESSHTAQLAAVLDALDAGEPPPVTVGEIRPTMELLTGLYRSVFTGLPTTRAELTPADPFYHQLHGGRAGGIHPAGGIPPFGPPHRL